MPSRALGVTPMKRSMVGAMSARRAGACEMPGWTPGPEKIMVVCCEPQSAPPCRPNMMGKPVVVLDHAMVGGDHEESLVKDPGLLVGRDQAPQVLIKGEIEPALVGPPVGGPVADRIYLGQIEHEGTGLVGLDGFYAKLHHQA